MLFTHSLVRFFARHRFEMNLSFNFIQLFSIPCPAAAIMSTFAVIVCCRFPPKATASDILWPWTHYGVLRNHSTFVCCWLSFPFLLWPALLGSLQLYSTRTLIYLPNSHNNVTFVQNVIRYNSIWNVFICSCHINQT